MTKTIEKDSKGYVKKSFDVKATTHNGCTLTLWIGEKEEDGSFEDVDYWATEEQLQTALKAFCRHIELFGLPRKGDVIDDGTDMMTVHEVWCDYGKDQPEICIQIH